MQFKMRCKNYSLQYAIVFFSVIFTCALADIQEFTTAPNVAKSQPIVIHTQAQIYDQPTLSEYEECQRNLDTCLQVCETANNTTACEKECPTCPILLEHNVLVQGINDTNYRAPTDITANHTNIIRLTNEIQNIIENNLGNITARNENNIHIHQNISDIGGLFGLGYNQNGSCCFVIQETKDCDDDQFSTASKCHHKRRKFCSEKCKARIMYAKRVKRCNYDETGVSECRTIIKYEIQPTKTPHTTNKCRYVPNWPFVSCPSRNRRQPNHCRECLQIPYGHILKYGVPKHCSNCYAGHNGADYVNEMVYYTPNMYPRPWQPMPYYPIVISPDPGYGNEWEDDDMDEEDQWKSEALKCRSEDGTITDNCNNIENEDDKYNIDTNKTTRAPKDDEFPQLPEAEDEIELTHNNNDNSLGEVEAMRHRRRAGFKRSAYSHRKY
ncbi:uncharacterized protein LOC119677182 [Teleopsis dalmanni]|uniref:uncharacterized protein LOC119677182 n=1 Tax=Teleopsis dalmanni TaxID=139649 RepID=UPI0018CF3776|nr:uncharacterized protein LOC119677182 [Teleopsis dalmanni]